MIKTRQFYDTCSLLLRAGNLFDEPEDFMSEKTGCFIAESRAHQKYLKFVKNCEILPKLEALNHLKSTLVVWESDTPNYFLRRLNSEIKNLEEDLMMCKRAIDNEQ